MDDEDSTAAFWAQHELELEQFLLSMDPEYQAWLDRLDYQAEIARVQLDLFSDNRTH